MLFQLGRTIGIWSRLWCLCRGLEYRVDWLYKEECWWRYVSIDQSPSPYLNGLRPRTRRPKPDVDAFWISHAVSWNRKYLFNTDFDCPFLRLHVCYQQHFDERRQTSESTCRRWQSDFKLGYCARCSFGTIASACKYRIFSIEPPLPKSDSICWAMLCCVCRVDVGGMGLGSFKETKRWSTGGWK